MDETSRQQIIEAENKLRQEARRFLLKADKSKTGQERLKRVVSNLVHVDIEKQENISLAKDRLRKMLARENRLGRKNSVRYNLNRHIAIKQALNTLNVQAHCTQSSV